ncbi:transposable element Tc1 transposase [Trichonephila clavipes]|nr:transposable element Tc1 transposase [Trichonephila clavipes]
MTLHIVLLVDVIILKKNNTHIEVEMVHNDRCVLVLIHHGFDNDEGTQRMPRKHSPDRNAPSPSLDLSDNGCKTQQRSLNINLRDTIGRPLAHLGDQLLNGNTYIHPNAFPQPSFVSVIYGPWCITFATSLILGSPIFPRTRPDHRDENCSWSTRCVAGQVDHSECAVRNCWKQWTREVTPARKTGSGATIKTTRRDDPRIVRQALVDPTVTRSTIRADVGVAIVPQTISRHFAEANLKSKRPFRVLPLTPEHRQLRLQWCQARSMWNVTDWQKVVFSDESRFVLGTDDNRVRVWRRPGERYNSPHTALRHTARTAGVMVWGAIAYDSRSTLIVMRGTLTGQRYVDDILRLHVGSFLNGHPGAIFQQDNARPHTARVAQDFLRHFQTLPWPARSPDLSPVEHVWDQLKRQMPSCHSVHDFELAVQGLWAHLPQDNTRCLNNAMPNRVAACIAAGGGSTRY